MRQRTMAADSATKTDPSDAPAAARDGNLAAWLSALAALGLFVMLSWPMWTNRVYTYDDIVKLHIPYRYLYSQALRSGDSILWTPRFYCGYYYHGEGEAGFCHPLHWLLYRTLPLELAFNLEFVLNYAWLFAGMFFLLRRWTTSPPASLLGALIFTFSGFSILHFMHLNALGVVSQLPWLLLACDVLMCAQDLKHVALAQLAIALLTALQHLAGYPQFAMFCLIAEGAFVLWRTFDGGSWRRIPLCAVGVALGFAIGAVQLLPTWDLLALSDRSDTSLEFRTWFSMHPLNLLQLWAPYVFHNRYFAVRRVFEGNTHEMGLYTTAFSTVALAWLAIRWRNLQQRWFVLATFLFGLAMLVLALGKYTPVYPFVAQLPLVKSLPLRCPTRYSMLTQLAMAMLAAFALVDLLTLQRAGERVRWLALWPLGVLLLLAALTAGVALAVVYHNPSTPLLTSKGDILAGLALVAGAVGLVAATARGVRWAPCGIILLTAAEIGVFDLWQYVWNPPREKPPAMAASAETGVLDLWQNLWNPPPEKPAADVAPPLPTWETLPKIIASSPRPPHNTGRLCYPLSDPGNMLTMAGYDLMQGYTALKPAERLPLVLATRNGPMLSPWATQIASVHWVFINNEWHPLKSLFPPAWNVAPLPRVRMVAQSVVSRQEAVDIQKINPATTALVDRKVDLELGLPGMATIKNERPGRLDIEAVAPTRQLLVVSERYHTGWQATVDGKPATLLPAYGEYLSCVVPAGTRKVEMLFQPASFAWGLRTTLGGVVAAALLAAGMLLWAVRRGPAPSAPSPQAAHSGRRAKATHP